MLRVLDSGDRQCPYCGPLISELHRCVASMLVLDGTPPVNFHDCGTCMKHLRSRQWSGHPLDWPDEDIEGSSYVKCRLSCAPSI